MIIDGKKTAAKLREELKNKIAKLKTSFNSVPGLTVILIGEDTASEIYVKKDSSTVEKIHQTSPAPSFDT